MVVVLEVAAAPCSFPADECQARSSWPAHPRARTRAPPRRECRRVIVLEVVDDASAGSSCSRSSLLVLVPGGRVPSQVILARTPACTYSCAAETRAQVVVRSENLQQRGVRRGTQPSDVVEAILLTGEYAHKGISYYSISRS